MNQLTQMNSWKKLEKYAKSYECQNNESENHCIPSEHITLDYSGQRINSLIMDLLFELANECNLYEQIDALMSGKPINNTENRPALHTALRAPENDVIWANGQNVIPEIVKVRNAMKLISTKIRTKEWLGYSGKPITDVVNIGIGGSMRVYFPCYL